MSELKIITICGSMRFYAEMLEHASNLTRDGVIVLMPFITTKDEELKFRLDELHKRKIDMSDGIFVVNPGGYIGQSTKSEIEYALVNGKMVEYSEVCIVEYNG